MFHPSRTAFRDAAAREMELLKKGGRSRLRRYIDILGPWVGIALFAIVMASQAPAFFSQLNTTSVIMDASSYIILAVGMTFVITGAGIDLSVGSIVGLSGAAMTMLVKHTTINPILTVVICLAVGALLGLVNGLLITKLKMPDFVVTMATMVAYRGITMIYMAGRVFYGFPPALLYLGQTRLGGIVPLCIVLAILVVVVADFLLYKRTRFGRYTVAIGGNRTAAIHAGIPADRYKIYTYIFSGFMAALGGAMLIGRLDSFTTSTGQVMMLPTIAAVVIGGTALYGGVGRLWGSLGGALLLCMVMNGLVVLGLGFFWQQVAVGIVIVLAVMLYTVTGLRQSRGVGGMGG